MYYMHSVPSLISDLYEVDEEHIGIIIRSTKGHVGMLIYENSWIVILTILLPL